MEKKSTRKEAKGMNIQGIFVGGYVLFSALVALFSCGVLSIVNALILILCLFVTGKCKGMKEISQGLLEECKSEY